MWQVIVPWRVDEKVLEIRDVTYRNQLTLTNRYPNLLLESMSHVVHR